MTDETLRYMKALQPFFKGKMGEWQVGDEVYFRGLSMRGYYSGFWTDEGRVIHSFMSGIEDLNDLTEEPLRIPRTIDDRNPERGLWRMVDWEKAQICQCWFDGTIDMSIGHKVVIRANIPTLAILKALAAQERIEI